MRITLLLLLLLTLMEMCIDRLEFLENLSSA